MEAKIVIIGMSPRLPYLKTDVTDTFSISFLYQDIIKKIDDIEIYINNGNAINISISNNPIKNIHFYLIRNGSYIIGYGEIPLVNSSKWFNLIKYDDKNINSNIINTKILEEIRNPNNEKKSINSSTNKDALFKEIIKSHNIKFKFSVELLNYIDSTSSKANISLKASADSNSNSIANTCSNSKTPKITKNFINLLPKNNNILLKNKNPYFKKIDIYSKDKSDNTSLFSTINNKILRNQPSKKLKQKNKTQAKVFSFNDYYNINNNTENREINGNDTSKNNILSITNCIKDNNNNYGLLKKTNKLIDPECVEQLSNIEKKNNNSSKILKELIFPKNNNLSKKKFKNKSTKKIIIKNKDLVKNIFEKPSNKKEKPKLREDNLNERKNNSNSFMKIEDVIIDQEFKNEIKNDELLGLASNNSSVFLSSFYSTRNKFYNPSTTGNQKSFYLDINHENDEIILFKFKEKENELFKIYSLDFIKKIKKKQLILELHSFIRKIVELQYEYQNNYKDLYQNFINYKNSLELFHILFINSLKKKNKLEYLKVSLSSKKEKNNLLTPGFECFKNAKKEIICKNEIPFWHQLINENIIQVNLNKNKKEKYELTKIFLDISQKNQMHFNSLSKKCYNDIKINFLKKKNNYLEKSYKKQYYSPSKNNELNDNDLNSQIKIFSKKNDFYSMSPKNIESNLKTPQNRFFSKKSLNLKKEELITEKNKISSLYGKNNSKNNKKTIENIKYKKNKYK